MYRPAGPDGRAGSELELEHPWLGRTKPLRRSRPPHRRGGREPFGDRGAQSQELRCVNFGFSTGNGVYRTGTVSFSAVFGGSARNPNPANGNMIAEVTARIVAAELSAALGRRVTAKHVFATEDMAAVGRRALWQHHLWYALPTAPSWLEW
jgi:hypothetical protein